MVLINRLRDGKRLPGIQGRNHNTDVSKMRCSCPKPGGKEEKDIREMPTSRVGPGQMIYLHSSKDTNWPDLYLNMITMT